MKATKLIVGILSIALFLVMTLQSYAACLADTIAADGKIRTAGFLVAIMLLAGGIVAIVGRKHRGASIACSILYSIGAILGFANTGYRYKDLYLCSTFALALALFFFISIFVQHYAADQPQASL